MRFFFKFYLFVIYSNVFNTMRLSIRFSNILCRELFLICLKVKKKNQCVFVRGLSPPQIFSKIKLVQNRPILNTSGGLSWHNKRIGCPFWDKLSFEKGKLWDSDTYRFPRQLGKDMRTIALENHASEAHI